MKKILVILLIAIVLAAYWLFDLDNYLTLEGIKNAQTQLENWRQGAPLLTGVAFFLIYVTVTALSLPGAAVLTLGAGAIFGIVSGVLVVSFASTIGATLAFLVARFILRDTVQRRFGKRLQPINKGIEREGAFYLFTLRLVPIFPFFVINLLMGLTSIRTRTFYWVSQVGMLAGTIVYVNAGTQLAAIETTADILSPGLLASFAVLGLFPLLARKFIERLKKRQVYRKWQRPNHFDRNLVVIGAGAAGLVSAYIAAAVKAKVTLVEAGKMGGDCLNFGCVPSKALIKSAKLAHHIRHGKDYGLETTSPAINFREVMKRVNNVIAKVAPHDSVERYTGLGLFPLLARKFIERLKKRQVYRQWQRPNHFDRNLVVIGAGAAGLVSAYIASAVKAKVTLVEAGKMGGDCLNFGCVPSKALIKSAKLAHHIRHGKDYGLETTSPAINFREVMKRVNNVIVKVAPHDSVERYTGLGVEVLAGRARLIDPWTVEVQLGDGGTTRLTARSIIIAAGAQPFVPPLPGLNDVGYLTSDTLWDTFSTMDEAPRRLVLLGGGPIGCELSEAFARLGSEVWQVEMAARILSREDIEVSELARDSLKRDGVHVLTGHKAIRCELDNARKFLVVEYEGSEQRLEFDALICAVGRAARLQGYGLEELGIPAERTLMTNEYLETLYPNIYAAGDVTGPFQFTHTAGHQAWYAAVNSLFGEWRKFKADYSVIPWSTFIDPEVARVGLNEQEAKEQGITYEVTRFGIDDLDRAIADGADHGFIKVLTVPGKDRILGVTIVGEHAGDLLAEFVLAMKHGLGLNKILGTIHIYPTLAEANKYVAGEWKRAHAPQKLLAWVEKYHNWKRKGGLLPSLIMTVFLLVGMTQGAEARFDHQPWDGLLQEHVQLIDEGRASRVDYRSIKAEQDTLRRYLETLAEVSREQFEKWLKNDQLAFLINAYNAWTVELILQKYPGVKSIKELGTLFQSPWKKKFIPLFGKTLSLDDIEHGLIRQPGVYDDPRIHFAVNCASIGCPALGNRAYDGAMLDSQLDQATRHFLADTKRNRMEKGGLKVSSIFKWYRGDFESGWRGTKTLGSFFALYSNSLGLNPSQAKAIAAGRVTVDFLDYDWRLNDLR